MNNLHLILTVDYELFGNGSGRVCECILDPADRMIAIAEQFGIPLTFFVEPLEIMALESEKKYADTVDKVINQIRSAVKNGHDTQLHLHPQWKNASLSKEGDWIVDMSRWRIGNCSAVEIREYIAEGKKWIESVCSHVVPDYQCLAFRAGGWCIQPSQAVLSALIGLGFKIDSTVAPGIYNLSKGEWFNFRQAPYLPYWAVLDDVCRKSGSSLLEVPIATGKISIADHFLSLTEGIGKRDSGMAPGCTGSYSGPSGRTGRLMGKISKICNLGNLMLDFCTLPSHILIKLTKQWIEQFNSPNNTIPVVAIGHTKNFSKTSETALIEYLLWARNEGIVFSTFPRWLEVNEKSSGI